MSLSQFYKAKHKVSPEELDSYRRRARLNDHVEVPDEYLYDVFYKQFLQQQGCHLGVHTQLGCAKGRPAKWFGLSNPTFFYMFDVTKVEDFSAYIPQKTTEERWTEFLTGRPEEEQKFSFHHVFATLREKGYISQLGSFEGENAEKLDRSCENAVQSYLETCGSYSVESVRKRFANEKKKTQIVQVFVEEMEGMHHVKHIVQAWLFNDCFLHLAES